MSSSKNKPRDPERVRHMLEAVIAIDQFMPGHSLTNFLTNKLLQSAVERQFEILGEAASHVSIATQTAWPSIDWREAKKLPQLNCA